MSHVVVIDSALRRHTVKTTPGTPLTSILEESCSKFGLNSTQYGLRNHNKKLDLSLTYRLSGLPSGAKLELVQLSKSPSVVSVALQLPDSEAKGSPNGRLTDKFPSNTTLWMILRKFEAGVAGGTTVTRNLTARSAPAIDNGDAGAGRLYYEQPILQVVGRELSSFTDLQKTLAQLGFNTGSTLLRLSFRTTDMPLEKAMEEIGEFFKSVEGESTPTQPLKANETAPITEAINNAQSTETPSSAETPSAAKASQPEPSQERDQSPMEPSDTQSPEPTDSSNSTDRPYVVYGPSTSTTPQAALRSYNDNDYVPSVQDLKRHQANIVASTRPQRLPTDAELAASEAAAAEKLAATKSVRIKIRFPDEYFVEASFTSSDRASDLYSFIRHQCLDSPTDAFQLTYRSLKPNEILPNSDKRLIQDLKIKGSLMVIFAWSPDAPLEFRTSHSSSSKVLKDGMRSQARQMTIEEPNAAAVEQEEVAPAVGQRRTDSDGSGQRKGLPKWLKLGKK